MELEYRQGCLIDALLFGEVGVIAHQANCFNTMGSGVALDIKRAFPEAYAEDCLTARGDKSKLGTFSRHIDEKNDIRVYNLYGQYNYGRFGLYTNYDAIFQALVAMAEDLESVGYSGKIGLPLIGCGSAGGDWDTVKRLVQTALVGFEVIIYSK